MEQKSIIERLLDSEEHADESAVPSVAYDAVNIIQKLQAALQRLTHPMADDGDMAFALGVLAQVEGEKNAISEGAI